MAQVYDNRRVFRKTEERVKQNFDHVTQNRMITYDQYQQQLQQGFGEVEGQFVLLETNEFYSINRTKENVLMIDEILDNASSLKLSEAQKEDMMIRRNRVKDFELLNHRTRDDSDEMTALKEQIREYDAALSQKPQTSEQLQEFCTQAMRTCNIAIRRCDTYLGKGKSWKFWKSNRNERYHLVEEAKARYLRDVATLETLLHLGDAEKYLRANDTMLDLMNLAQINDRLVEYDNARRAEREAGNAQGQNQQEQNQNQQEQNQNQQQNQEQQQEQQQQREVFGEKELEELGKVQETTPEIVAIKEAITNIQTKMSQPMPVIKLNAHNKLDRKEERKNGLDNFCVEMVVLFARLYKSITHCLKLENGAGYKQNGSLKRILEQLRDQTKTDRTLFRERVVSYRAMLAEDEAEAAKAHTWRDAWKYVRAVSYDLDHNPDLEIKNEGAGASDILVIENKKTKEKVFFRKEENAGGINQKQFVEDYCKTIEESIKCEVEVKNALFELFKKCGDGGDLQEMFEDLRRGDEIKKMESLLASDELCTEAVRNAYQNASQETKKEMGKAVGLFARKCFQRSFSSRDAKIEADQSLTARNVATSRMAMLLGIGSMVSDSRTAVIKKDGKEIMGNVMEDTQGHPVYDGDKKYTYTDQAIGETFMLQVFDILCGQIDRHYGNFHVITNDKGEIESLKALDNDMAFGDLEPYDVFDSAGYNQIRPITKHHFRALPEAFAKSILALDMDYVREALGDLLDDKALSKLRVRLQMIQACIREYSGMTRNPETGNLEYQGEDKDDTLRMLKAVKSFKDSLVQYETDDKKKHDFYKFKAINYNMEEEETGWRTDSNVSLIRWDAVGDLQERINKRIAQLQPNNQAGNNQAGNNQEGNNQA